jgi:transglutaminase-like putative cysteine protease
MKIKVLATLLTALCTIVSIGDAGAADAPAYKRWYDITYTIRSAELIDVTQRIETEVGTDSMVQSLGQHRITNNDNFYDLEIVEAATIKADGRRIDVIRDQIVVLSGAEAATNILFQADIKTRVIPFPQLAAGDRTLIVTKVRQKQAIAIGGTAISLVFSPAFYFTEMNVTVDVAHDQKLQIAERVLHHETEDNGDRTRLHWRIEGTPYTAAEANAVAPIDWAPMLAVSTFETWDAIGQREFAVADPKSAPTSELRALADTIAKDVSDHRAQAAAIFDWVARNIRYYQIVLNQGGLIPHEANSVLTNRYGDCKDHATLMRALLRAKDIDSEYVLINAGNKAYRPFDVPMMAFDHMILYLPEFDLYVDPTAATATFGVLPAAEHDRSVLRFGNNGVALARTPGLSAESGRVTLETEATIAADGTVTGKNVVKASGPYAIEARNAMRVIEQRGPSEVGKELLAKQRWAGSATFDVGSPFDRSDPYEIRSQFNLTTRMFGADVKPSAVPTGPRMITRPVGSFPTVLRENRRQDFYCLPVIYEEKVTIRLPEGKTLAQIPKGESVIRQLGEYKSSYLLKDQTLTVSRTIIWRTPGSVCSRQIAEDLSPVSQAILRDTANRLLLVDAGAAVTPNAGARSDTSDDDGN